MQSGSMPEINYNTDLQWQERALHYGDGLFETLLKLNQEIPLWQHHLERLSQGCKQLSISTPDPDWLVNQITEKSKEMDNCVIKIIVSRGQGGRGLKLPPADQPTVLIYCYPWSEPDQLDLHVKVCDTRLPINLNLAGIKHLNRLDYVLASLELQNQPDIEEGILCDSEGYLVEGIISNLFFVISNQVHTPSLEFAGVAGIMRKIVLAQFQTLGIPVNIGRFQADILNGASEVFLCNSVRGISPVISIDERQLTTGDTTRKMMASLNRRADWI
jgi:4-amino-4-deoxychorismate lyase